MGVCRRIVVIAAALCAVLSLSGVGDALAAQGDTPPPLGLRSIGAAPDITFAGQQAQVSMSIPVPQNLAPDKLRGITDVPPFVTGGTVDVLQGDRVISRTPINPAPNSPIELPLAGTRVTRNAADITLRAYLTVSGICQFDPDNAFHIRDATLSFSGREAIPRNVAEFLPPILRKLTIFVPQKPTSAEASAAVGLATSVAGNYGTADFDIDVAPLAAGSLAPSGRPDSLERQIVISEAAPAGLAVQNRDDAAYLVIGGAANELTTQARVLTSNLSSIAQSSSAVAGPLHTAPQLAPEVQTLADVGVTDQLVTSSAWPSITLGIDQTRLGRPSKDIRVQLIGSATPAANGSSPVVSVRLGQRVIATIKTDGSGAFDQWVDLPNDALSRYNGLVVTLERGDVREGCGNGTRGSLSVSAAGEIRSSPASPPLPAGLGSMPQALMPRTQLAWTTGDVPDVARAVSIMTTMQRLSAIPLGVDVVSMADAASSTQPAVLIAADGQGLPDGVALPVTQKSGTVTVRTSSGTSSRVTLNPGVSFGSLQVTRSGDRSVMVATSTNDAADLDGLLRWFSDTDNASNANGDAVLQISGREPITVDATANGHDAASNTHPLGWLVVVCVLLGAVILFLIVAAALRLLRRRRLGDDDAG
ncbi:hypothetical protein [Gordonia aichiensis]|uniref:Glycoprotein n=1 Tax=Gordonia aichiensis NBRC 108223 TaxID=1220583 RepID=L7KEA6_9ACTN|nr:hypothetical protein GOACH_02_00250 [Gordonia aichiensis NBRC 108223]